MPKLKGDWRLAGGFTALLFLIIAIGLIGISQIQYLSKTAEELGSRYFPMQKAALEMRIANSLYAVGIRNYIFWRSSKYLEAAKLATNRQAVKAKLESFNQHLAVYASFVQSEEQRAWLASIETLQNQLKALADKIIDLVDQAQEAKNAAPKEELENAINKLMMSFENRLSQIDEFIDRYLQKDNLEAVRAQLAKANLARKQALTLLSLSLLLALLIGGATALAVYHNRRRERQRREQLVQKMIRVEEDEKERLALQVHDQMGQDLSGLRIYLDLLDKRLPPEDQEGRKHIEQGKKILSALIDKGHNIAELLRPPELDEVGLVDTLQSLVLYYQQLTEMEIVYQKPNAALNLSKECSLLLYRATQEGLTNIVRYAHAKRVEIALELKDGLVQLSIQDDGAGFDYRRDALKGLRRRKEDRVRLGLLGLEERVELLNGRMQVKTAPGQGTRLIVQLPLQGKVT